MLEKNFNIKQKFVNESKPFHSFTSQNLFKLPQEKSNRTKLICELPTGLPDKDTNLLDNAPIKLLNESDSEVSECVP